MKKSRALHKWKKQLLFSDKIVSVLVLLLLGIFNPSSVVVAAFLLLFPYLILTRRTSALKHLAVAFFIALAWMMLASREYQYNFANLTFFGLNAFPLFSWSIGLFMGYLLYSHWEHKLKRQSFIGKLILFSAIYWPLLILVESVAYHLLNIQNLSAAVYQGLPLCNCIHAPRWMQTAYFLLGPIYFSVCDYLGLENPHYR